MKTEQGALFGQRIAVTGVTGFIGRRLLPRLLSEGAHVVALTRDPGKNGLLQHEQVSWVQWSLERAGELHNELDGVCAICHLAAHIPKRLHDMTEAGTCLVANGIGTLDLLQAAKARDVPYFLNISAGQLYAPLDSPASERDVVYPSFRATSYLTSKLVAEIFVDHFGRTDDFGTASIRVGSPYGPGMSSGATVSHFIQQALRNEPLQLVAGGTYAVDLVFIEDVTDVILKALKDQVRGIFNIGSGEKTTLLMLAREIIRLTRSSQDLIEFLPGTPDPGFPALDIELARSVLGYSPTPLPQGLSRMIGILAEEGASV